MIESQDGPFGLAFGDGEAPIHVCPAAVGEAQDQVARKVLISIDQWFDAAPADGLREAIEQLEAVKREVEAQIVAYQEALAALAEVRRIGSNGHGHKRGPTKREAVLDLLRVEPEREFKLSEIREQLIAREVMPDTERAAHALQMTLQNMNARGEVARVRPGFYKLAPLRGEGTAVQTNGHRTAGDGR